MSKKIRFPEDGTREDQIDFLVKHNGGGGPNNEGMVDELTVECLLNQIPDSHKSKIAKTDDPFSSLEEEQRADMCSLCDALLRNT